MFIRNLFALNIKRLRTLNKLTQEDLCEKTGLSLGTIKKIETEQVFAGDDTIEKIAVALKADPSELFKNPEYTPPEPTPLEALSIIEKALKASIKAFDTDPPDDLPPLKKKALSLIDVINDRDLSIYVDLMQMAVDNQPKVSSSKIS